MFRYYFAYGSNIDFEKMKDRGIEFISYRKAILENYTLKFNKYSFHSGCGVANVEPKKGDYVEGILYKLKHPAVGIKYLDLYEGFYPDNYYDSHYFRKVFTIKTEKGEKIKAYIYVANPIYVDDSLKPSKDYLKRLLSGCIRGILSRKYCEKLKSFLKHTCNTS